jgi:hypothetical protein
MIVWYDTASEVKEKKKRGGGVRYFKGKTFFMRVLASCHGHAVQLGGISVFAELHGK